MRVYIDGENFRHSVAGILRNEKAISHIDEMLGFPVRELIQDLLDERNLGIVYYASKIKLPIGYEPSLDVLSRANQIKEFTRQWVPHLKGQNIEYIKAGYLKVKSGRECPSCKHVHDVLQEKGVDVRIAVDIMDHCLQKPKQTIVLFSSDTDLIPALDRVKRSGTRIIYIAYSEGVNRAISETAHETITFTGRRVVQLYRGSHGQA